MYKTLIFLTCFFIVTICISPQRVFASGSFTISNTSPFLGDPIIATGSGLLANHQYYLYLDEAGIEMDYNTTTYQGLPAKQFTATGDFTSGVAYYSYSEAYNDFDYILALLNYYDGVSASPLFNIYASDVHWSNGGGTALTVNVSSSGSNVWKIWSYVFNKDQGVPSFNWQFAKVGSNNVYFNFLKKYPAWSIATDSSGNFTKTINAPRTYSKNNDLNFTLDLYDTSDNSSQTVGQFTLTYDFNNFREAKDMLTFHYIDTRPEVLEANFAASYVDAIYNNRNPYRNASSAGWDVGWVGAIFDELGNTTMRDDQTLRLIDDINHGSGDLRCYMVGAGNYTDCAFAGWLNLVPNYQATGSTAVYNAMVDILNYAMVGYNATYNNFSHSSGALNQFWDDAGGGKPQFFWYMGNLLNNPTYKNYALTMINTIIDKEQTSDGWVQQIYNFATDTIVTPTFWDGGQGWALSGLYSFREEIKTDVTQSAEVTKINMALQALADNLSSRPIGDLRTDLRRTPMTAYYLLKLSQDTTFPATNRSNWQTRGEQLFILALQTMNNYPTLLTTYGLTYDSSSTNNYAFTDYYILKIINDFYPTAKFFPNNIGSNYSISKSLGTNDIYQAYLNNTNDWTGSTSYYNQIDSSGTTLKGTSEPGKVVKYLKREMIAAVTSGSVDITISEWTGSSKKWTMTSSTNQNVDISFTGLTANRNYKVLRDGTTWEEVSADSNGILSFTYDGGFSTHSFELQEILPGNSAPSCNDTVPTGMIPWIYQASANNGNSITLKFTNWQTPVDHFALEYGTSSNNYQYAAGNIGGNNTNSYTVNSLNSNTTYYFRVRTGNGCATGAWSNELSAKTLGSFSINNLNITESSITPVEQISNCQTYTVKSGDTLWKIASSLLGDGNKYTDIASENSDSYPSLKTSDNLSIGWSLKINCTKATTTTNTPTVEYKVNIKVKDTKGSPVENATVTLHSTPQTAKTNSDGVATFNNVKAGNHTVDIAYNNYQGKQSINLTGDVKEFNINVTIEPKNILLSPQVLGIVGVLVLIIIILIFKLIKKNKLAKL